MNSFFTFVLLIFLVLIIYFWIKNKKSGQRLKKRTKYIIASGATVSFILAGVTGASDTTHSPKNESHSSSSSSQNSKKSSDEHSSKTTSNRSSSSSTKPKKYNFSKIKLGMSQEQVIKILGKPSDQTKLILYYGEEDLDFTDDKLIGGSPDNIQSQVKKKNQDELKRAEKNKNAQERLKSMATYFGTQPVQTIQKKTSVYASHRDQNNNMLYTWHIDDDMLVRIDDTSGFTTVYQYDKNADNQLGKQLYQGKTIVQEEKTRVITLY